MATVWQNHAIALTGSPGAGKSTVSEIFRSLGAFVVSADDLAKEAVKPGSTNLAKVVQTFGRQFIDPQGELKREELGKLIFSDSAARKRLEQIIHPVVAKLAEVRFEEALRVGFPLYVYECPLLFEAELNREGFKKIVVVKADPVISIQRFQARTGLTQAEALRRFQAQLPVEQKISRADLVIENSGTLNELKDTVTKLFGTLAQAT